MSGSCNPMQSMTADEFASLEKALGASVKKVGPTWWREVRPCFFRPLPWFKEFPGNEITTPVAAHIGGYQHLVEEGTSYNSLLNVLLFPSPRTYSLEELSSNDRYHVRRAMKSFKVKHITDLSMFIDKGHEVYISFYNRTKYSYKKERIEKKGFAVWAQTLFHFPKVQVYGAFSGDQLMSVSVSYVVEQVLFTATFFSRSEALGEYVSDLMLHSLRERAAEDGTIRMIYASMAGMERGLDEFYLRRGAQLIPKPAQLYMNPVLRVALKTFKKSEFKKLGSLEEAK